MQIRRVDTARRGEVNRFIQFPFELYRTCPQWVPPLWQEMRLVLNREQHPFYEYSDAEFLIAEHQEEVVGRLAVMNNRNYNRHHGQRIAFFYYFDVVNDLGVAQALFDAGQTWARTQGLTTLIGPKGFLQGDGLGMLAEGFEHRPAMGIPYNYAYYNDFMERLGFVKETDFYSGYLAGSHELPPRFFEVADRVKARRGFEIKSFSSERELRQWIGRIGQLYNDCFVDNWEYCPITPAEMQAIADRMLSIANPRLIKLVMKGDDLIGFVFPFPDLSAAIQKAQGRLWPIGWLYLLREFSRTKWVNFNGLGLLPQHQGVGANSILYTEVARTIRECGFEHADVVQVEERNAKSQGDMAAIGVSWYKKHRIYRSEIGD